MISANSVTEISQKKTFNHTSFVFQNTENNTDSLPCVTSDLVAPSAIIVCRVCLAMNVKMYHISEHKLRDMYKRVTGVAINKADKLPQNLCWECVGRLSSANNFTVKALKTQRILFKKLNGSRSITIDDIKSIDKTQNQLESTLGIQFYKENESNLHIIEETDKIDTVNETVTEFSGNCCNKDIQNIEFYDCKKAEGVSSEGPQIKSEEEVIMKGEGIADECYAVSYVYKEEDIEESQDMFVIIIKKENGSDDENTVGDNDMLQEENPVLDNSSAVCDDISEGALPSSKELTVVLEDIMLNKYDTKESSKQLLANDQSTTKEKTIIEVKSNMEKEICNKTPKYKNIKTNELSINDHVALGETGSTSARNLTLTDTKYSNLSQTNKLFICDICDKPFHHKFSLIQHILKHPKTYNCTYCSYKSFYKYDVKKHTNVKHTKSSVFYCSYCSYKAYEKAYLDQHINTHHTKSTVFNCSYCDHKSYQKGHLNQHIKNIHFKSTSFNCSYCDYKAYQKSNLNQHINSKHTRSTVFNCSYCDYKAYQKVNLNQHINSKHTKSAIFNCSYCDYTAHQKGHLVRHINTHHTKKTVFTCSYCDYKAYQKVNLNHHINSKHTKNSVFNCSYCDYKAYQRANLDRHISSRHSKSTAFNCTHCSYETYHKSYLNRHIKAKHKELFAQ